ncbi:transcriptional adapter 3 [Copidosoma floridanum]|uniref:transcriptional adapter 3 n=1 Tax=Copidosoma floridanum TaxID=29053 RepID=UPI0006C9E2DB|nr:transcriptional adapter 3 [Copidosoma floridanum]
MSGKGKQHSKKSMVKSRDSGKLAQQQQQQQHHHYHSTHHHQVHHHHHHQQQQQQSVAAHSDTSSEGSEMINIPVIKLEETMNLLPKYHSILQRNPEDGISMEDLDTLQGELEILLSSAVVRKRTLQEEIINLSASEERRDRRSKSSKSLALIEKKLRDDKLKPKDIGVKSQSPLPAKLLKQRASGSAANQVVPNPHEILRVEGSKSDVHMKPKNDTCNKFWASVDPYCTDITPDDIKLLEELIASHSDLGEYKTIPPLGRHYSLAWAHSDLMQEEEAGNPNKEKKKSKDIGLLLAKGEKKANGIAGPLTQRLVSALLEENVYVANNNSDGKLFRDGDSPVLRDLSIQNSMNLEMRMHKELVEQGILEPDSQKKNPEDDEILTEIKRCQRELMALSSHNQIQLKKLLHLAQEESKRQALKRKIAAVDNEVVEHYEKLLQAKQRKIPLTKKETEKAWASLKERENLLEQLNMLPANSIGEPVVANNTAT